MKVILMPFQGENIYYQQLLSILGDASSPELREDPSNQPAADEARVQGKQPEGRHSVGMAWS